MTHLTDVGMNYVQHLIRAWSIAFILIVHGVFPNVWKTRANELLCDHDGEQNEVQRNSYQLVDR